MIQVFQKNENNNLGFYHKDGTDFGIDENGNLAAGFQYHDAMWWNGSSAEEFQKSLGVDIPNFLSEWKVMFTRIAEYIVYTVKPKSILELGCGSGELSKYIRDLDSKILTVTIDANQDTINSPYYHNNHFIGRTDKILDFCYENGERVIFDLIMSFEHFEHISESTTDVFLENIEKHSKKGTKLIFTANQNPYPVESHKHIHCNSRSENDWINEIKKIGFESYPADFTFNRAAFTSEIFSQKIK